MLYGQIKPIVIRILKKRLYYPKGIPLGKPLLVISYNMKKLLVANERTARVYTVLWKDVEVIDYEKILQVGAVRLGDNVKVINRSKEKKGLFNARTKSK